MKNAHTLPRFNYNRFKAGSEVYAFRLTSSYFVARVLHFSAFIKLACMLNEVNALVTVLIPSNFVYDYIVLYI